MKINSKNFKSIRGITKILKKNNKKHIFFYENIFFNFNTIFDLFVYK